MGNKDRYFLLGGGITLFFNLTLFGIIAALILHENENVHYSLDSDAITIISLESRLKEPLREQKQENETATEIKEDVTQEDFDPFSELKTEAISYDNSSQGTNEKISENVLRKIQARNDIVLEQRTSTSIKPIVFKKTDVTINTQVKKQDLPGIKDAYRVMLRDKLTVTWQQTSDVMGNYTAEVYITISASGRLSYKVKYYSKYEPFDKELDRYLEYQTQIMFDPPPNAQSIDVLVNFTSRREK